MISILLSVVKLNINPENGLEQQQENLDHLEEIGEY